MVDNEWFENRSRNIKINNLGIMLIKKQEKNHGYILIQEKLIYQVEN